MNAAKSFFLRAIIFGISLIIIFSIFAIGSQAQDPSLLTLTKNADPLTYSIVGQTIDYTFVIGNSGIDPIEGPFSISDDKVPDVPCPNIHSVGNNDEFLDPLETMECNASYTITQADLDAGSVTNTATANGLGTTSDVATVTITAVQSSQLTIDKSADPISYDSVGDSISYSYLVTNSGNVTLNEPFTVIDNKTTVTCLDKPTSLAPGDAFTCTATYTITQEDLNTGSVTNTAYATGSFGENPVTSLTADNTISASLDTTLTLDKTSTTTSFDSVGDPISYSYKLTNSGNVVLSGAFTITDDKATVDCPTTASLEPGAFITCSASYTIKQSDLNTGSVTNTAVGHAFFAGSPVDSNEDSETVQATLSPKITLTKTSTETSYKAAGNVLHYQLSAKNDGNVTLTNVAITDPKLGPLTCNPPGQGGTLAPLASLSCTGTYTIIQADLIAKSVTNTATSEGKLGANTISSNTASQTVFGATFTVDRTSGLLTDENGTTDTFTIKLDKKPSANVEINLSSNDPSEGIVFSTAKLTFTPDNWNSPQTVTIKGVNDNIIDGNVGYTIITSPAVSSDQRYNEANPPDVSATNGDNDVAGLAVSPISGLITSEGKTSAKIQVKLNTQPTANVTLNFASSDLSEGTVEPASLIIKPADWNLVKEVTVTGVDDKVPDGNINYKINISASSSDGNYQGKKASVSATNRDAPTIEWISPVRTGQIYEIDNLVPFLLKVVKDGTEPITRVKFYRWDALANGGKGAHVNIGEVQTPPYQIFYDPSLPGNKLNPEFNQFFAVAYNSANVASENIFIWVYKQGSKYTLYLPLVIRDK